MQELIGKYLNGYRIVKVEKDPFIQGQINLWTDDTRLDFLGDREVVKFYVRDYPSGASIYQEQVDKENYQLKSIINELEKDLEDMYYGRGKYHMDSDVIGIKDVLDKIKTLKDGGKNEPNE